MRVYKKSIYNIIGALIFVIGCKSRIESTDDMAYFEGGKAKIGCDDSNCRDNETPLFDTLVDAFYLDKDVVSVSDFEKFVAKTNYQTDAEKFGDAGVLNPESGEWELVKGAYWKYPLGTNLGTALSTHPVTQVSWNDACAYCKFVGKRLPTNNEWEYAAKYNIPQNEKFSWGNVVSENGKYLANVWQGSFPEKNLELDGYRYTAPVGMFGKTKSGLSDMGGNVWQWCADEYRMYKNNTSTFEHNPDNKVIRGGSFLCDSNVCYSYRTTARNYCSKETALFHMGFRCAKSKNKI
jgi:sulfatase modifying factor 1